MDQFDRRSIGFGIHAGDWEPIQRIAVERRTKYPTVTAIAEVTKERLFALLHSSK